MNRTFKETPSFTKKWQSLGLTDEDLRILENILLKNPKTGDTISGTGGLRKIRIPINDIGKRGGGGVIMGFYEDMEKSLLEAIEMEKGNLPMKEVEDMPAPTYIVSDKEREVKNKVIMS